MKKTIYTLSALVLFVVSCAETPVDYAVVSGKIKNEGKEMMLRSADPEFSEELKLGEDGSFSDTIRGGLGGLFILKGKNDLELYLDQGSDITIDADAADFDNTLAISGEGSGPNAYLTLKRKIKPDFSMRKKDVLLKVIAVDSLKERYSPLYSMEELEFKDSMARVKKTLTRALDSMKGEIDEGFVQKEKRNLKYEYLERLNGYSRMASVFAVYDPNEKISDGFLDELDEMDYNREEDYAFSRAYRSLLKMHCNIESFKLRKRDSLPVEFAKLKVLETISNETIRNDKLFREARRTIPNVDENEREEYYTAFKEASTDKDNNAEIEIIYNKVRARGLDKGNPSPKFTGYENYKGGITSLDDLKGKYVFIDVWATWCAPCKAEIPYLEELEEEYRDKNIEFVSISIDRDKDRDKWRAMIEEEELKGIQLMADNDWKSEFVIDYGILSIPRFIMIDPEGNIVSSKAPRPSSPDLKKLFDEVL